jgi:hypothetical protein
MRTAFLGWHTASAKQSHWRHLYAISGTDAGTDLTGSRSEVVQDCSSIVAQASKNAIALTGVMFDMEAGPLSSLVCSSRQGEHEGEHEGD